MSPTTPDHITPTAGAAYRALVEEPGAPIWTHPRQDRLTPPMRAEVTAFARLLRTGPPSWGPGGEPAWLDPWLREAWRRTPGHAARGPRPDRLVDIQPLGRRDLAADSAAFVPQDVPVEELLAYQTSGTAGPPTTIPGHPISTASYYPLLLHAARPVADLQPRPDVLDWVTLISQQVGGYIIPSWSSTVGSLTAQVNLQPHGWQDPDDATTFLSRHDPRCLTGDPVAFHDLLRLDPDIHPDLLVSTAATLGDGLRADLEERFGAPVLDVYSVTECGPIAVSLGPGSPTQLVQPRLFVEAVRPDGTRCEPGETGEVAVTGGLNRALTLIRHRTGDHAAMTWPDGARTPVLTDLQARAPVVFTHVDGRRVNSHSVTVALRPLALPRFTVHQRADGAVRLGLDDPSGPAADRARLLLTDLLGRDVTVETATAVVPGGKVIPFRSDLPSA